MRFKLYIIALLTIIPTMVSAQSFKGYYYNDEYQLFLYINAEEQNITVPGQDIYGELPGYFGSKRDGRLWLITEMSQSGKDKAEISVINDYGSEDFTAVITEDEKHELTLKHKKGSVFKIVVNSKYVKIPKEIKMKRMDQKR